MSRFLAIPADWLDSDEPRHRLLIWIAKQASAFGFGRCESGQVTFTMQQVARRFSFSKGTAISQVARIVQEGLLEPTGKAQRQVGMGEVYNLKGDLLRAVLPNRLTKELTEDLTKELTEDLTKEVLQTGAVCEIADQDSDQEIDQAADQGIDRLKDSTSTNHQEPKASSPEAAAARVEFLAKWNTAAEKHGWVKCRSIAGRRKAALDARLAETGWAQDAEQAMAVMAEDKFFSGGGARGWIADLEFFVRPGRVQSILDKAEAQKRRVPKQDASTPKASSWAEAEAANREYARRAGWSPEKTEAFIEECRNEFDAWMASLNQEAVC